MDNNPDAPTAKLGTIGRYQILEALESGGMGTVYRAFDPRLQTQVCIKQIKEGPESAAFQRRWLPEVRAIAQLRHHPNIVNIYDASDVEFGGRPTIVMEFIEGRTLQRIIRDGDRLSLATRLHYIEQLAAGLSYAHSKNIVHRDIKPANLIVDKAGVLKILDFGIARMSGGTTASAVVGTMNYMSPEQWGKDAVDSRSDIFSVGAVFYEMLGGRRAFPGDTVVEVYPLILSGHPVPLEELCPGLDADIVRVINRMLEKRPADRYQALEPVQREVERIRLRLTPAAEERFTRTFRWEAPAPPIAALTPPTPGRPIIDRESVARRRAAKIEAAVAAARQAFAASSYDDVLTACGQALELDPEHALALDLLERARAALHQREVQQLTADAREHFARRDFMQASKSIEAALALSPGDIALITLRDQIARAKSELDRARARDAAIQNAMALAHATIDSGEWAQAGQHLAVVLALDGAHAEALRLRTLVQRLVDERQRAIETSRAAPAAQPSSPVDSVRHLSERAAGDREVPTTVPGDGYHTEQTSSSFAPTRRWLFVGAVLLVLVAAGGGVALLRTRPAAPAAVPIAPAPAAAAPTDSQVAPPVPSTTPANGRGASPSGTDEARGKQSGEPGVDTSKPSTGRTDSTAANPRAASENAAAAGRRSSGAQASRTTEQTVPPRLAADRYLRRAQENLDIGDWDAAASNAEKARALDPSNPALPKILDDIQIMKRLEQGRRKGAPPR